MATLFALDVGTRKVCGLLVDASGRLPRVSHWAMREHPGRAMQDGQVQGIAQAAEVIAQVREDLERASGLRLHQAHVAVAGRSLSSLRSSCRLPTGQREPLSRAQVAALELEAVRRAREALEASPRAAGLACVGYSVLSLRLDGESLPHPEGHRGDELELEVLATFMPQRGLEALQAALAGAGLSAASLTLEPIAAVQLMVPPELRRLNLGLVDVGAGTSDLALTREGRVDAFAMVPVAGDEISERLSESFLLDFMQAEDLKRALGQAPQADVTDIFGARRRVTAEEAFRELEGARRRWAGETAAAMLALNEGRPPQAVLLAGGGSQLPGLGAALAEALGLPPDKVGHRPVPLQQAFGELPEELAKAWAVTPLGIAASAAEKRGLPFAHFLVNGTWVQALNLRQGFSAEDALAAAGVERGQLYGAGGEDLHYRFNGQERSVAGRPPLPCRLFVNGAPASLDAPLQGGESLTFEPALAGSDGRLSFAEALEREGLRAGTWSLNGQARPLPLRLLADGVRVDELSQAVPPGCRLEAGGSFSLQALLEAEGAVLDGLIHREIAVQLEGRRLSVLQRNYRLRLNGREARLDEELKPGDAVSFEPGAGMQERLRDLLAMLPAPEPGPAPAKGALRVQLNGEWVGLDVPERVWMNGREASLDDAPLEGAELKIKRAGPCLTAGEALERLGLGGWLKQGGLQLRLNGEAAKPGSRIAEGDALDLEPAAEVRLP